MHRNTARTLFHICVLTLSLAALMYPCTAAAAGPDSPTSSPTTGKFDVSFTVTLRTSIPSNATIMCSVLVLVEGESGITTETYTTQGTRSGNQATCTNWFYYSWPLQHPDTDTVGLSYDVTAVSTTTNDLPLRDSDQAGPTMSVPANGAVTRITVDSTL
jgi:hypothetical protein